MLGLPNNRYDDDFARPMPYPDTAHITLPASVPLYSHACHRLTTSQPLDVRLRRSGCLQLTAIRHYFPPFRYDFILPGNGCSNLSRTLPSASAESRYLVDGGYYVASTGNESPSEGKTNRL